MTDWGGLCRIWAIGPSSAKQSASVPVFTGKIQARRVAETSVREASARVAREAQTDQDQVVEIPVFSVRKTG